jgi:hypothetical protein
MWRRTVSAGNGRRFPLIAPTAPASNVLRLRDAIETKGVSVGETDQTWQNVGEKFTELGRKFREHYEARGERTEAPQEEIQDEILEEEALEKSSDLKQAMENLGDGLERMFGSIGDSLQDEEVKTQARSAFSSLLAAIGETFSELGDEVRNMGQSRAADEAPPAEEFEPDGVKELREDLKGD